MLSKGTVSGAILTYEIAPAVKMQDLVDHFTTLDGPQPRMGTTVFMFLMNKAKYDSLPPDLKKVIDDNSGRNLAPFAIKVWDMIDADGLKVMKSKPKNKFVTLTRPRPRTSGSWWRRYSIASKPRSTRPAATAPR